MIPEDLSSIEETTSNSKDMYSPWRLATVTEDSGRGEARSSIITNLGVRVTVCDAPCSKFRPSTPVKATR